MGGCRPPRVGSAAVLQAVPFIPIRTARVPDIVVPLKLTL